MKEILKINNFVMIYLLLIKKYIIYSNLLNKKLANFLEQFCSLIFL